MQKLWLFIAVRNGVIFKRGDVIVLDDLGAHRASRIEEITASNGARVIWLPPYSPDFSPIELMWSKVKTYLKRVKARTQEELETAIAERVLEIKNAFITSVVVEFE